MASELAVEALDGNAMAGTLFEYFGVEMTTHSGRCGHCGAGGQMAELRVYNRAPGWIARCNSCGEVVIVMVRVHGELRCHMPEFSVEPIALD